MIINTNMNALNAHRNMGINNAQAGKSMEKLSSGLRINRAGDDAAGLAISEKMRGQIRGLDQASRNAQDGVSMIQTAEGALNETHNIIQRMRELSVQAGNDTNTADDRKEMQKEIEQLTSEVDRIANNTEFNTQKLLNGNKAGEATTGIKVGDKIVDEIATVVVTPGITAVAGEATVDLSALKAADVINIGGKDYTISAASTTNALALAELEAAVNADGNVTIDTTTANAVTIVQDAGKEAPGISVSLNGATNSATETTVGVTGVTEVTKEVKTPRAATAAEILANDTRIRDAEAADVTATEGKINLQVGANKGQNITVEIEDMRADALKIRTADGKSLDVSNHENANKAVEAFDKALNTVSAERSKLGAVQNRLEYTTSNLNNTSENLTAAESRIRDVDMAKEMLNFSKNNILNQAAQSMLAQAKSQPEGVLQLLR